MFCPNCGSSILPDDVFCQDCGYNLKEGTSAKPTENASEATAEEFSNPVEKTSQPEAVVIQPNQAAPEISEKKKTSLVLIIIAIVVGVGILVAGGWFGYNKFIKKGKQPEQANIGAPADTSKASQSLPEKTDTVTKSEQPEKTDANQKTPAKQNVVVQNNPPANQKQVPQAPPPKPANQNVPNVSNANVIVILEIANIKAVENNPTKPSKIEIKKNTKITKITNYHWNNGLGTTKTGTISLLCLTKPNVSKLYGPYFTYGVAGQGGVKNANWICEPNVVLPPGTYQVVDSYTETWSQNRDSKRRGFTKVEGIILE